MVSRERSAKLGQLRRERDVRCRVKAFNESPRSSLLSPWNDPRLPTVLRISAQMPGKVGVRHWGLPRASNT